MAARAEWAMAPWLPEARKWSGLRRAHATTRAQAGWGAPRLNNAGPPRLNNGAGNGIRTRDFDLGKVALYH